MAEDTGADEHLGTGRDGLWWVGTVLGVGGLVGFAVLGIALLVGVLAGMGPGVNLFPWALGSLALGVAGMFLAGSRGPSAGHEDGAAPSSNPEPAPEPDPGPDPASDPTL